MVFSQRLKALLVEKKVTWKEVSSELGIGKNQQKYWEERDITPDGKPLVKLATYFEVSSDFLLGIDSLKEKVNALTTQNNPGLELTSDEKWFILKLRELDREGCIMVESTVISEIRRIEKETENIATV